MTLTEKAKRIFKIILSVWIVYNIIVLLLMPNIGSYIGRLNSKFVAPYANIVGLNAGWNFFSPDPAHTMYIRYTLHFENEAGDSLRDPEEGYFPPQRDRRISNELDKRVQYAMRFMLIEPKRIKVFLGPWLCRQNPEASLVSIEAVIETVPFLDNVVMQSQSEVNSLSETLEYVREDFSCDPDSQDEVAL